MTSPRFEAEVAGRKLARSSGGALEAALAVAPLPTCSYPGHRSTDWSLPGGPTVCGVCHPPAWPLTVGEVR